MLQAYYYYIYRVPPRPPPPPPPPKKKNVDFYEIAFTPLLVKVTFQVLCGCSNLIVSCALIVFYFKDLLLTGSDVTMWQHISMTDFPVFCADESANLPLV